MSDRSSSSSSSGIGFGGLMTVAMFVLKILGYIDWSWWIVFSPVIFGLVILVIIIIVAVVLAVKE